MLSAILKVQVIDFFDYQYPFGTDDEETKTNRLHNLINLTGDNAINELGENLQGLHNIDSELLLAKNYAIQMVEDKYNGLEIKTDFYSYIKNHLKFIE